jgi:hypothetical protein
MSGGQAPSKRGASPLENRGAAGAREFDRNAAVGQHRPALRTAPVAIAEQSIGAPGKQEGGQLPGRFRGCEKDADRHHPSHHGGPGLAASHHAKGRALVAVM